MHFDLFFVMMAFAAIAVWLLVATYRAHAKWVNYERFAALYSKCVETPDARALPVGARVKHKKHCLGGGAHDGHVQLEDERSDRSSGEKDDRADKMLSREEFAQCFRGVPKFSEELVDDFLYLFELNSEGQIEFEEFIKVVKELKVLVHEAEK